MRAISATMGSADSVTLFVIIVVGANQQHFAHLTADAAVIQNPMRGAFVDPGQHNQIAWDLPQRR